jgi:hypothetical protein
MLKTFCDVAVDPDTVVFVSKVNDEQGQLVFVTDMREQVVVPINAESADALVKYFRKLDKLND